MALLADLKSKWREESDRDLWQLVWQLDNTRETIWHHPLSDLEIQIGDARHSLWYVIGELADQIDRAIGEANDHAK